MATPTIASKGSMVLQPSDERRRSGSHYTPRSLTEPIVKKAFAPIFSQMGAEPKPEQILELKVCDPAMGSGAFLVESTRQLSEALVRAWSIYKQTPQIPADEDELLFARRQIAQRCIYGVDKNPMAVDLAKLSLWLSTFAKDHAFTFLDHSIKCGDSLVGLTLSQISNGTWEPTSQDGLFTQKVKAAAAEYVELRHEMSYAAEDKNYEALVLLNEEAQQRVQRLRAAGDLILSAFFLGKTDKERSSNIAQVQTTLLKLFQIDAHFEYGSVLPVGMRSFHWELEFPEVFQRSKMGFDTIIGNPPFLGGKRISSVFGLSYKDWLADIHSGASANADLVAHFFRRAGLLLREYGTIHLIATNTIAQGDTRASGLRILTNGDFEIYDASRRVKWPGVAAVVVSTIALIRGRYSGTKILDGKNVEFISAFLFRSGSNDDPARLQEQTQNSYIGTMLSGVGFLFEDDNEDASPLSEMNKILDREEFSKTLVKPYIGGEDVTTSSNQTSNRYVIDFGGSTLDDAQKHPLLLDVVRRKVKPYRDTVNRKAHRERWWQFGDRRPDLYRRLETLQRCLVHSQVSSHIAFCWQPTGRLLGHTLNVFTLEADSAFSVLQCRVHEIWARFFGSSMKDDLRYTPSDCFETFPFPVSYTVNCELEEVGRAYYEFRTQLMIDRNEGLTKLYNHFHDPDERSPELIRLRALHSDLDRATLAAYGWTDVETQCEFLLDYEDEETDGSARKTKKPWRYRWPDHVRDDVLARLLDLNAKRAEEESLAAPKEVKKNRKSK